MGEGMTEGGRCSQHFFPVSVNNSFSMKEMRIKYGAVDPVVFKFYMFSHIFITIGQILNKKWEYVRDDKSWYTMSAEKNTLLYSISFTTFKDTRAHRFELQGLYLY